jgi:hypothetical protein
MLASNALAAPTPRNASICACAWITLHPEISHASARFLVIVAQHMNRDGTAYPGLDTIAGLGGMKRRTAQRALARLLKHPEAPITRRFRRNTSPIYTLTLASRGAPYLANQKRRAPAPGGATDGTPDHATGDTPDASAEARSLGATGDALTLKNLQRTANGNGASKEGKVVRPEAFAPSARPSPVPLPLRCGVGGCTRDVEAAGPAGMFCDLHNREKRQVWTSRGGRL